MSAAAKAAKGKVQKAGRLIILQFSNFNLSLLNWPLFLFCFVKFQKLSPQRKKLSMDNTWRRSYRPEWLALLRLSAQCSVKYEHISCFDIWLTHFLWLMSFFLFLPLLQRNLNIANFVKDFNDQTKNIKDGIPLMTRVQSQVKHTN